MRIHLATLGCRLNEAEIATWSRQFSARGHQIVPAADQAELMIVNTCAVTNEAVAKSRKLIRRARRNNPQAKLVITGCYATREDTASPQTLEIDLLVPNEDKDRLVEIASQRLDLHSMPEAATRPGEDPIFPERRHRAFVKIQDGCRYRCSFCVVTLARGEERSRNVDEIVHEVQGLARQGVREVVLTGVHVGGYGQDLGSDLGALLRRLLTDTDMARIRLGSLEPWDVPDDFWPLFADSRFMPHLHLPLQSGADSVLRRMSRRCRTADFEALVDRARTQVPDLNLTTDVIVGFPGETDEEWARTLAFVERVGFGHLHIFTYSPRSGTKAATMPGQVEASVKRQRSRDLHDLGARMKRETLQRYTNRDFPVLIEGTSAQEGIWVGYTPNFLRVHLAAGADTGLENEIRPVRLESVSECGEALLGRLLET